MIVSKLVLKNWRNFKSVDIDLTDRVFIIGPNASGKSNLLDAIRFLRDIAKPGGGLQTALTQRGGLSKVRCLAARRDPDVEIEVQLSENGGPAIWTYALGITQQVRGYRQPVLRFEKVWDNEKKLILDRPDSDDKKDGLRLTQTHLEQISSNSGFREIARLFESVRYLHLVPQLLRNPEALQAAARVEDPYGRSFLETVAKTTEKTRKSRLKKIESALQAAVPQLKQLTDVKDEAGVPHLEALWEHWRPNAGLQREDQFSDGTLRLIGLFWSLLDGDAPLLLEEPELSLNSAIVSKLPEMFYRMQRKRKRQLFVSTHSWELLSDQGIAGQEVVLLKPTQEGSEATIASSIEEVRRQLEAGLSVADVVLPRTTPRDLKKLDLFE